MYMTPREARQFRNQLNGVIEALDDETAMEVTSLFPEWSVGKTYYGPNDSEHAQSRVRYNGGFYKCTMTHTVTPEQTNYNPEEANSLWARMDNPAVEWPEWVQPIGAHDAYDLGAKVSHNGKHWISNIPANVFEPGVAGWDEVQ